ncbi:hypothetical protein [Aquitalea pelogenes]|uniref:hypothetical protein n=1 Tax=Aquitalea pelogenes TaxID=1293573 RepID=UPI0035B1AD38
MKYEVIIEAVWPVQKVLIIEAENEDDAEDIAIEMAEDCEIDWDLCSSDCIRSFDVVQMDEYDGDDEADNEQGEC